MDVLSQCHRIWCPPCSLWMVHWGGSNANHYCFQHLLDTWWKLKKDVATLSWNSTTSNPCQCARKKHQVIYECFVFWLKPNLVRPPFPVWKAVLRQEQVHSLYPTADGFSIKIGTWYGRIRMALCHQQPMPICSWSTEGVLVSAQAKSEAPLAGLEWCVEAEESPFIASYSCWKIVWSRERIW